MFVPITRIIAWRLRFTGAIGKKLLGELPGDDSPIGFNPLLSTYSRSATAYFGNSCRSFFSRLTSVVNCFGSCFARAS
jgi:hypothetical protein